MKLSAFSFDLLIGCAFACSVETGFTFFYNTSHLPGRDENSNRNVHDFYILINTVYSILYTAQRLHSLLFERNLRREIYSYYMYERCRCTSIFVLKQNLLSFVKQIILQRANDSRWFSKMHMQKNYWLLLCPSLTPTSGCLCSPLSYLEID